MGRVEAASRGVGSTLGGSDRTDLAVQFFGGRFHGALPAETAAENSHRQKGEDAENGIGRDEF